MWLARVASTDSAWTPAARMAPWIGIGLWRDRRNVRVSGLPPRLLVAGDGTSHSRDAEPHRGVLALIEHDVQQWGSSAMFPPGLG